MSCSCFHRSHQKVYPAQVWIITSLPGLSVLFVISTFPFCSRLHVLHCSSTLCRDILCCCLWSFPYRCKILPFFSILGKCPLGLSPQKKQRLENDLQRQLHVECYCKNFTKFVGVVYRDICSVGSCPGILYFVLLDGRCSGCQFGIVSVIRIYFL